MAASGNIILVPGHELFVANACSGLNSVVTLLPLAVVIGYFLCGGLWRRVVLVASVLPLAFFGNAARVAGTVMIVETCSDVDAQSSARYRWVSARSEL